MAKFSAILNPTCTLDAIHVWLASSRGLPLSTLDRETAERARAFCKAIAP